MLKLHRTECHDAFSQSWRQGRFCDLVVRVDGCRFPVHRLVVAQSSSYMDRLFEAGMADSTAEVIDIPEMQASVFEAILTCLYEGSSKVNSVLLLPIVRAAARLQVGAMLRVAVAAAESALAPANVLEAWDTAERCSLPSLEEAAKAYALRHFQTLSRTDSFHQCTLEQLRALLSDDLLSAPEDQIFLAIGQWARTADIVESVARSLYEYVRFPHLTGPFVSSVVMQEPLLRSLEGRDLLARIYQQHVHNVPGARPRVGLNRLYIFGGSSHSSQSPMETIRCCADGALELVNDDDFLLNHAEPGTPFVSRSPAVAAVGMKLYLLSGSGSEGQGGTGLWIYDPRRRRWSQGPDCPTVHTLAASAAALDGKLYVAGNYTTSPAVRWHPSSGSCAVSMFDPVSCEWHNVASLAMARGAAGMAAFQGMLWIVGGQCERRLSSVEAYDPVEGQWKKMAPLRTARCGAAVAAFAGKLWAIGGEDENEGTLRSVEVYDPAQGEWCPGAPLRRAREGAAAVVVGDCMYITGGKCLVSTHPKQYTKLNDIDRLCLPDALETYAVEESVWKNVGCSPSRNVGIHTEPQRRDYHTMATL